MAFRPLTLALMIGVPLLPVVMSACKSANKTAGNLRPGTTRQEEWFWSRSAVPALDLVLVIDNSPSMRDKQPLLQESLVQAVRRLIVPDCVDDNGDFTGVAGDQGCLTGSPMARFRDVRVAVLSSSLGGHGSELCPREVEGMDDRAHLIPSVRPEAPDPDGNGFLWWRAGVDEGPTDFLRALRDQIAAVGSTGCEFEAPLETWYRFLVDPTPPQRIVVDKEGQSDAARDASGALLVDEEVLAQRERFLRPTGVVLVVVVSDESDCSVMDGGTDYQGAGLGHRLLAPPGTTPNPSAACASNPNDACCFSCDEASEHPQCEGTGCATGAKLSPEKDPLELRCFDPMRRFGRDLRYPIERYVDALSKPRLLDARTAQPFDNPLLLGAGLRHGRARDPGMVFFATLGGLPWQDVAEGSGLDPNDPSAKRLRGYELHISNVDVGLEALHSISRWELMLGKPGRPQNGPLPCQPEDDPSCGAAPQPPWDPFLVEGVEPRAPGNHPLSGDSIVYPEQGEQNSINRHESAPWKPLTSNDTDNSDALQAPTDGGALQPACLFELHQPLECAPIDTNCACAPDADGTIRTRAICESPGGSPASSTQFFAEASPATRQLSLAQKFGSNSIVASLCPKNVKRDFLDAVDPNFGYNLLFQDVTFRNEDGFSFRCGVMELTPDESGLVDCAVIEGTFPRQVDFVDEAAPRQSCEERGRLPLNETKRARFLAALEAVGRCGKETSADCNAYEACELRQLSGQDGLTCQRDGKPEELHRTPGYCYVDASDYDPSNAESMGGSSNVESDFRSRVTNCPSAERRTLRFVGDDTPTAGSIVYVMCQK